MDTPTRCDIRALIRFIQAKFVNCAEIHRELSTAAYCLSIMSSKIAAGMFMMKSVVVAGPSIASVNRVENVDRYI
jgi:hypothetical protein